MSDYSRTNDTIVYIDTPYHPEPGSFCKPKTLSNNRYMAGQWFGCREVWHNELKTIKFFFFSHLAGKTKPVITFMTEVEDILDVKPRSHYGPTQRKTITWIEPSRWWIDSSMRRSLFTILLRVSQDYRHNFEEALYSHQYTQNTRVAVERFMNGYTVYTGRRRGWYRQFCILKPTNQEIDILLVKEKINK